MTRSIEILYAISELSDALGEQMTAIAAAGELTVAQFNLLYIVAEEGPTQLSEIARSRRCVKSNVSNLVRGMERAGLVELTAAPHDRRARVIHPTALGRRRFHAALDACVQVEHALSASLGKNSAAKLAKLCLAAAAALDE